MLWNDFKLHIIDGYFWRCRNKSSKNSDISIRRGSFLFGCSFLLKKILQLILGHWIAEKNHYYTIFQILQSISILHYLDYDVQAINKIRRRRYCLSSGWCFSYKAKNHRGSNNPTYVFGIVDTSYKPSLGYMCVVPNRKAWLPMDL
jgi:hypothetical protein